MHFHDPVMVYGIIKDEAYWPLQGCTVRSDDSPGTMGVTLEILYNVFNGV